MRSQRQRLYLQACMCSHLLCLLQKNTCKFDKMHRDRREMIQILKRSVTGGEISDTQVLEHVGVGGEGEGEEERGEENKEKGLVHFYFYFCWMNE